MTTVEQPARELRGGQGLMLALDFVGLDDALALLGQLSADIDAVKIGTQLLTAGSQGTAAIREISSLGVPLLVDCKLLDVSHIVLATINNLVNHGARAVTLYALCGESIVRACIDEFQGIDIFLITGLTSAPPEQAKSHVLGALAIAESCGVMNAQVPGNRPELVTEVRRRLGDSACLIACGMGAQGGISGDAIRAGADYEIVGRHIYLASDPRKAAQEWRSELTESMADRQLKR